MLKLAKNAHYKTKTDAAGVGTFMHKWVSDYIMGKKPPTLFFFLSI
jgi:hypothetical protein